MNKTTKISKYRRKGDFNVGVIIFIIIFVYIVATIVSYATRTRIATYEVRQGRVLADHSYVGIAIREEQVVTVEVDGYVYYFHNNLSKIRSGADVIAVSPIAIPLEETLFYNTAAEVDVITNDNHDSFIYHTRNFMETVDLQRFSTVQNFRSDLTNSLRGTANQVRTARLDDIFSGTQGNVQIFPSPSDGIMVMRLDGMEGLTLDNISGDTFLRGGYEATFFTDQMQLSSGEAAFKLITSENWYIVIETDEEIASLLNEKNWARIRFIRDDVLAWANPIVFNQGEEQFVAFSLNHSMIRYAQERFINIELILEDQRGLMIPRTAVIEKEFFRIPNNFVVPRYTSTGIIWINEEGEEEFSLFRIYNVTPEGDIYINPNEIPHGTVLVSPDTGETLTLNATASQPLIGVYNINHGYAVFRFINIITGNEDYYVIEEGNAFSLSNFDFIALIGDSIEDGEIVAR
jgi:hypothetical protein